MQKERRNHIILGEDYLMGTAEAAHASGLPGYLIRKLCERGEIHAFNVLGRWRLKRSALQEYLASQSNQGGPQ